MGSKPKRVNKICETNPEHNNSPTTKQLTGEQQRRWMAHSDVPMVKVTASCRALTGQQTVQWSNVGRNPLMANGLKNTSGGRKWADRNRNKHPSDEDRRRRRRTAVA
ncbi:unnamed protein product [Citrullus colocynthis]|uniref:Uncharacterized protein n=1 Tax=Citrullus colocynthis TaxID=252529 RepID=A0ABP0Y4W2_9ROSI